MNTTVHNGTAVVTGASSGIGAAYADRLAKRGFDLIVIARSGEKLLDLATRITDETGQSVETMTADLTRPEDLAKVEKVLRTDASITLLVNSAGIGSTAPLLHSDIGMMDAMVALNVTAVVHLVSAMVPGFVARRTGTIINIASIAGLAPELLNGIYGASKAFVLAFTQSLDHELSGDGVRVQAVLPVAVATKFWELAGIAIDRLPTEILMSPEAMVDAALAGLDRGELVTVPAFPELSKSDPREATRRDLGTQFPTKPSTH